MIHNLIQKKLRSNQTDAEGKLWPLLRNRSLSNCKFRRQHPICPYVVDFCCIEKHLIVEVDGGQHSTEHLKDERRTRYLSQLEYKVLRFWNHDVLKNINAVLEMIHVNLDPHPGPLPKREREIRFPPLRHKDGGSVLWRKGEEFSGLAMTDK